MFIKVFHTPFGLRGFTEELFRVASKNVKDANYSRILYLAPTPWKIQESERVFHNLAEECYVPPEMLTIKQLARRLHSVRGRERVISQSIVPVVISLLTSKGIGFSSLMSHFIEEIKQYHPGEVVEIIRKELRDIFHDVGIPDEVFDRTLEAIKIFESYERILNSHNAVDENDVMTLCPKLIELQGSRYETLVLDGFYELTGSEEAVVKALIAETKETLIRIPYDIKLAFYTDRLISFLNNNFNIHHISINHAECCREISYHPYKSVEEELEGIARSIKNHFISGQISDLAKIIVVFPHLGKYAEMARRIFGKYGIPCSVSRPKPLGKTKPLLDLIALLESVSDDYPRLPFCQFLTSPHFRNLSHLFRKYIPGFSLMAGIVKGKDLWMNLSERKQFLHNPTDRLKGELRSLEKELTRVFKTLAALENMRYAGTFSGYSEVISKILTDLDFSYNDNEDTGSKKNIGDILRQLSFIDDITPSSFSAKHPDLRQFIEAFTHILNTSETEKGIEGVRIMDFIEISGMEPDHLYFGGLKDGDFPSKPDMDHLLPDSVRRRFGLVDFDSYLGRQKFLFFRALSSAKNVHLSYPETEGDRIFLPSSFLPWNKQTEKTLYGIFSLEEELVRKGTVPFTSQIEEIRDVRSRLLENKFGETSFVRVTDIDSYRACPRKFYIERVLRLEPPEIKKYEIEAALLGTIAHEVMQFLISESITDFHDLSQRAHAIMDSVLADKPVDDYWKEAVKSSFLKILPDIFRIEKKIADEGYRFMDSEVSVQGEVIKGIRLKGTVDRVDKRVPNEEKDSSLTIQHSAPGTHVQLIDYKTGTTQFSGTQVLSKGASLQLFLYASLMKSLGLTVERTGIYSLKDMKISWIPGRNDRREGRTIENYIEASLRFLEETIFDMRKLEFPALPLNEQTCRTCPERPYCPYIQKAVVNPEA